MSDLDVAKEKIAYLKVWLGILVVTDISLIGWLVINVANIQTLLLFGGVIAVVAIGAGILFFHKRISRLIESLRDF